MFNLYEILQNAQGGQAIDNLAAQFYITAEEADAAVKAVVPALSDGFLKQASQPLGFGSFVGALGESQHLAAFTDSEAMQATATAQKGGDILSQVLGSQSAREEIALRAASATGISADTLSQMLPVIVSMIVGGLTKSLENQGFGGMDNSPMPRGRATSVASSVRYWAARRHPETSRHRSRQARPGEPAGSVPF